MHLKRDPDGGLNNLDFGVVAVLSNDYGGSSLLVLFSDVGGDETRPRSERLTALQAVLARTMGGGPWHRGRAPEPESLPPAFLTKATDGRR